MTTFPSISTEEQAFQFFSVPGNLEAYQASEDHAKMLAICRTLGWLKRAEQHLKALKEQPRPTVSAQPESKQTGTDVLDLIERISEALPVELKNIPRWITWSGDLKNKEPYISGTFNQASTTTPGHLASYDQASQNIIDGLGYAHLGFVPQHPLVGLDLDSCRDPKTGNVHQWATEVLGMLGATYTEVTPSQAGLRAWVKLPHVTQKKIYKINTELASVAGKAPQVELLVSNYGTITGQVYNNAPPVVAEFNKDQWTKVEQHLAQYAPAEQAKQPGESKSSAPPCIQAIPWLKTGDIDGLLAALPTVYEGADSRNPEGIAGRDEFVLKVCCKLQAIGWTDSDIYEAAARVAKEKCSPAFPDHKTKARSALKYPKGNSGRLKQPNYAQAAAVEASQDADGTFPFGDEEPKLPESAFTSTRLGDLYNEVFKPNDWPVELALPSLATAGGVLVPIEPPQVNSGGSGFILRNNPIVNLYTALISEVHAGKTQVIEWSAKSLGIYREVRGPNYVGVQFGSAEQMWKFLNKHSFLNDQTTSAFRNAVLINPDEWAHVMAKAGIPDSSFAYALTTAFYKRHHTITLGGQGGGRDILIPFPFSMAGGIVKDEFDSVFGATTVGGLYDRFLFGLAPEDFMWSYRDFPITHPLFQGKGKLEFTPTSVQVDPSLYEVINHWNKKDRSLGRIVEMCSRVATIFASMDGRTIVTGADLEKLWPLAKYQQDIRAIYRPNPGMNPDAVYSNSVLNWVGKRAQQWRTIRELQKGTNYQRRKLGPYVCQRTLKTLAMDNQVELWTSTVRADGWLNPLPPDYQGPRPKIGSGLVRIGAR